MNFFDHKDLGNQLLQLCPKVVKHPVYVCIPCMYVGTYVDMYVCMYVKQFALKGESAVVQNMFNTDILFLKPSVVFSIEPL